MKKVRADSITYRERRPVDILMPKNPTSKRGPEMSAHLNLLPDSWKVALTEAEEWPFLDPDDNGLSDPQPDLSLYPNDPAALPDIEPYSDDEPWGKMINETSREYELFSYFRSLGITRSLRKTAENFHLKSSTITTISKKRNWAIRASSWDEYRERVYTAELLLGVKEMAHKHASIAAQGIEALATAFQSIVEMMENDDTRAEFLAEIKDLPAKSQLAIAQNSARVLPNLMNAERLSRGLPTEISANLSVNESRVTITTTDDLHDIISGLIGPLSVARSPEVDVVEVEAEELIP